MAKKILKALIGTAYFAGCFLNAVKNRNNYMKKMFTAISVSGNTELIGELIDDDKVTQQMLDGALYNVGVGKYETGLYLLKKGANPNDSDMPQRDAFNNYDMHLILLLTSDKTDVNQKNKLGHSVLYQVLLSGTSDHNMFVVSNRLLEKGAKIEGSFFKNNEYDENENYGYDQIHNNPLTIQMLIKKYLSDGGKLDIPDAVKYAFCGEIDKCIEVIEKSSLYLTKADCKVIADFASAFGTVEQYEKVCRLLSTDRKFAEKVLAGCGNVEMMEYVINKNIEFYNAENERSLYGKKYDIEQKKENLYSECLSCAASWGNYDICKYIMDKEIRPELAVNTLSSLSNALDSRNFKVFKEIYNYIETNFAEITERQLSGIFNSYGKGTGLSNEMDDFDKQVLDFLFEKGHTFEEVDFTDMHKTKVNYLIEKGVEVTDKHFAELAQQNNKEGIELALKKGYKIIDQKVIYEQTILERAVECSSHDTVKVIIDSGVKLPDNIMETARYGSKATAKVLIEAGAKTDLKYTQLMPVNGGGLVKEGDFDLADYYKHYRRDDLAKLVKK